jgi:NAD(P)-dependent dehydrogenase (short-subunit alcohol dehydrogenase family)
MKMRHAVALAAVTAGSYRITQAARRRWTLRNLRGLNVAITGGSRGLGLVLARCCLAHGANVAICARDAEELARAVEMLEPQPDRAVLAVAADVTDRDQARRFISRAIETFGHLDVLINNAGVIQAGPWNLMNERDFEESLGVHLWAPIHTVAAAFHTLRARQGRIVNIASIGGKISVPHLLPYSAGKFALVGLSEGLAVELARYGMSVTTVCPGLMRTGSPRNAWFKGQHRAEYAWFSIGDSIPLLTVSAEEAARRILAAALDRRQQLIFPLSAQAAALAHDLAPGMTTKILSLVNRLLPGPGGIGARRVKGSRSTSRWSPSPLTYLTERAAQGNNEVVQ